MTTPSPSAVPGAAPGGDPFEASRPRLFALAYRLLGSRSEAEDVLQDAWLRWHQAERAAIRDPEAWLVTATTRLGLDRLRAARTRRATYPGPWLPEPVEIGPVEIEPGPGPDERAARADDLSLAFLALLETLAPDERAAFLLKEAFDYEYARIAELIGHSEANCRQLVHRARGRLREGRPRFPVRPDAHRVLLERFMRATRDGDRDTLMQLLATNARLVSDGGGRTRAAIRPLLGAERIARFFWALSRRFGREVELGIGTVNGEPALLRWREGRLHSVTTIVVDDGRITQVLSVVNPDKLPLPLRIGGH